MDFRNSDDSLCLFFTKGVSLKTWIESGTLNREKSLYEHLLKEEIFKKIYWFTYGSTDKALARSLYKKNLLDKRIIIIQKNKFFKGRILDFIYSVILVFIHSSKIKQSKLLKSNQVNGSWTALIAKFVYKKPFLLRCGYMMSRSEKIWKRKK